MFGIRQSGILDFKLGDVYQDAKLLQKASDAAKEILEKDPHLEAEAHKNLNNYLKSYISEGLIETTI